MHEFDIDLVLVWVIDQAITKICTIRLSLLNIQSGWRANMPEYMFFDKLCNISDLVIT